MSEIIKSIITEYGPCAVNEALDYLKSDFFFQKGNFTPEEWSYRKVQYYLNKMTDNYRDIFKFSCDSGYSVRYGQTKFSYYLLEEPRFLKVKGYLKRCMFCGMPIYINETKVFHFRYNCKQFKPQNYFKLLKIDNFWAIISGDFVYGILDDLQSCQLRLPNYYQNRMYNMLQSELWLINQKARESQIIESDRLLPLKAEEYIS